jgi:hypothetical protein
MQKLKIRAVRRDLSADKVPILAFKCGLIRQVDRKHRIACIVNREIRRCFFVLMGRNLDPPLPAPRSESRTGFAGTGRACGDKIADLGIV